MLKKFNLLLLLLILFCTSFPAYAQLTATWTQGPTSGSSAWPTDRGNNGGKPIGRVWQPASFDTQRNRFILFGGSDGGGCTGGGTQGGYLNDWWSFSYGANAWLQLTPNDKNANNGSVPWGRDNHQITYDRDQDLYWMYGGTCSAVPGVPLVWSFNPDSLAWASYAVPSGVQTTAEWARYDHVWQYTENNIIVFHGGERGGQPQNDTWTFNTSSHAWVQKNANGAAGVPPARHQIQNAWGYDAINKKVLIFGGGFNPYPQSVRSDTWWYDVPLNAWTNRAPTSPPPARMQHAVAYDSANEIFVLYGGWSQANGTNFSDTRIYNPSQNAWTQLTPTGQPPALAHHNLQYDPVNQRMIMWGGATPSGKNTAVWVLQITNAVVPLNITTTTPLPNGQAEVAYSQTILATGGAAPRTFSILSGQLPAGLTLSGSGILNGIPTVPGTYNFTVRVTDSLSASDDQVFTLIVSNSPLNLQVASLDHGQVNVSYSETLTAVGGSETYNFSIISGTIAPGLSLNTSGVLSGVPTSSAIYTFTVRVADNSNPVQFDEEEFTLSVLPPCQCP